MEYILGMQTGISAAGLEEAWRGIVVLILENRSSGYTHAVSPIMENYFCGDDTAMDGANIRSYLGSPTSRAITCPRCLEMIEQEAAYRLEGWGNHPATKAMLEEDLNRMNER